MPTMQRRNSEAFDRALRTWQGHPERFMKDVLGWEPWTKQVEILRSLIDNKETYVKSCNAAGKSWLAAGIVLWWMFTRRGKVVTTAPTWRQVREVLWANIGAQAERAPMLGIKPLQSSMKLGADWYAVGLSTRVPDKFQGYHGNVLVVVDEASGVNDRAIWAAIDGNLTDNKNDRLLAIGNPLDPTSVFAGKFKLPQRKGFMKQITISAFDTPNVRQGKEVIPNLVSKSWVEQKEQEWGVDSPLYQARVLGEFPKTGLASLFPLHWMERAFEYKTQSSMESIIEGGVPTGEFEYVPGMPDVSAGVRSLGLDVSGSGMDNNAMCMMTGRKLQAIAGWPTVDASLILGDDDEEHKQPTFFQWVTDYRPEIGVIDASGLGDPIFKYAQRYLGHNKNRFKGFRLRAFRAGSKAIRDDKYENLKAESYFKVRNMLAEYSLDLSNVPPAMRETLLTQANAIRWQQSKRGLIMIESKDQMRNREGFSPDELEALIMAIAGGKKVNISRPNMVDFDYNNRDKDEYSKPDGIASFQYDLDHYSRS